MAHQERGDTEGAGELGEYYYLIIYRKIQR